MAGHKKGQMIPRGRNRWLLRIYLGRKADGKRNYSAKTFEGTTAQARQKLTDMLSGAYNQTFVETSKLLVSDFLNQWVDGKIDVSARTQASYRMQLKRPMSTLGSLRLQELSPTATQHCVSLLAEAGLSPRTIEYTHRILRSALQDAVRQGLLIRNPGDHVTLPRKIKRAPSILTMQQVHLFLEKTSDDPLQPLWRLLLTSGLRPGEALALKWTDINTDEKWASINRTLVDDGNGHLNLVEQPKADSSRRIGLPESTTNSLKEYKKRQAAEILLAGKHYERLGLIFANSVGHPLDLSMVRRRWKTALKAADLPKVRLYDCRHSHLTSLLQNGADIAWVAARAGHKNIKMTRDHYAHVLPEVHREMGEMTERLLQAVTG